VVGTCRASALWMACATSSSGRWQPSGVVSEEVCPLLHGGAARVSIHGMEEL